MIEKVRTIGQILWCEVDFMAKVPCMGINDNHKLKHQGDNSCFGLSSPRKSRPMPFSLKTQEVLDRYLLPRFVQHTLFALDESFGFFVMNWIWEGTKYMVPQTIKKLARKYKCKAINYLTLSIAFSSWLKQQYDLRLKKFESVSNKGYQTHQYTCYRNIPQTPQKSQCRTGQQTRRECSARFNIQHA